MSATLFPKNEGTIDRTLRVLVGLAILSLAFVGPKSPWAYLGLLPIVTGLLGSCPAYTLLGLSTCPMKGRSNLASAHAGARRHAPGRAAPVSAETTRLRPLRLAS